MARSQFVLKSIRIKYICSHFGQLVLIFRSIRSHAKINLIFERKIERKKKKTSKYYIYKTTEINKQVVIFINCQLQLFSLIILWDIDLLRRKKKKKKKNQVPK